MFEITAVLVFSVYFILLVVFTSGVRKRFTKNINYSPSVSVIVCARNEEDKILTCLKSLSQVKYPTDKIEFIIVDDNSTDKTGSITDDFIKDKSWFKKIDTSKPGKLQGKINALNAGISSSNSEIILLTDADCEVTPSWVRTMVSYYKENTGMVCGFTTLKNETVFESVQDVDLLFLISVASGTANIGKPVSCIGNNISFRRKAYNETGGFENLPFSVTEDYLLMNAISKLKNYEILFPLDKDTLVTSEPCRNIKEIIAQKKRWGAGGLNIDKQAGEPFSRNMVNTSNLYTIFIMGTAFFANFSVLLVPLFFSGVSLYLAVFKISADYFFLFPVCNQLGLKKSLRYFIFYEIYYTLYITVLPVLLLLNKKISWKGREF